MDARAYFARTFTTNCIHSDVRAKFARERVMRVKMVKIKFLAKSWTLSQKMTMELIISIISNILAKEIGTKNIFQKNKHNF